MDSASIERLRWRHCQPPRIVSQLQTLSWFLQDEPLRTGTPITKPPESSMHLRMVKKDRASAFTKLSAPSLHCTLMLENQRQIPHSRPAACAHLTHTKIQKRRKPRFIRALMLFSFAYQSRTRIFQEKGSRYGLCRGRLLR